VQAITDMTKLPPVFTKNGTITAGNFVRITDGASAVVLVSGSGSRTPKLKPLLGWWITQLPESIRRSWHRTGAGCSELVKKNRYEVGTV